MEFVDRRTPSRHNPTPPSRDAATYPLRCGGNRRLAMVRQLWCHTGSPRPRVARKPLSCILPVAVAPILVELRPTKKMGQNMLDRGSRS